MQSLLSSTKLLVIGVYHFKQIMEQFFRIQLLMARITKAWCSSFCVHIIIEYKHCFLLRPNNVHNSNLILNRIYRNCSDTEQFSLVTPGSRAHKDRSMSYPLRRITDFSRGISGSFPSIYAKRECFLQYDDDRTSILNFL